MDSDLLTVPEAATLLRLKTSTIRAWMGQHRISYVKLGRRLVRIRRGDVEALIAESVVPAPAENPTETKEQQKVSWHEYKSPRLFPQP
jgi:excisionase family DNA binding protein